MDVMTHGLMMYGLIVEFKYLLVMLDGIGVILEQYSMELLMIFLVRIEMY